MYIVLYTMQVFPQDSPVSHSCSVEFSSRGDILIFFFHKSDSQKLTVPFNNMRTLKFKARPTNAVFRYRQSNVRRLLPAFDCCRARGNQIAVHSSDNEQSSAVVVSWEDPPNTWLTAAKNAFVGWAFNFRVRVLLKSAVMPSNNV